MKIRIEKNQNPKPKPQDESKLGFGKIFTDHMFIMNYDEGEGWHDPRIVPYAPLKLEPSAMCLHYAQEAFEGLKAYRGVDGKIRLFRPDKNMARLNSSNARLCAPLLSEKDALDAIKQLVAMDADWIPRAQGTSLYIRPFVIGIDPMVGVHPARHLLFMIILSPVGAYYPEGLNPVSIFVENEYVRSVRGCLGHTKAAANYAASLKAQEEAVQKGFTQVLWLDGVQRKYIEEVGTMNVFFVLEEGVVTPSLDGSILPGITRMSVIELLRSWGVAVTQRKISIDELESAYKAGKLIEAFGSGTAAVISPIGSLCSGTDKMIINRGEIGELSRKLYDRLTGIQWGRVPDTFGWTVEL
ncbi:MAG: branched-chain amino acid aminotransferase [Oscillospiraceae bacterium]|nr:branched-chain amino acid aminotransferase [Oscillospiraceae bacterium]